MANPESSSVELVISNKDLLTEEILVRLPTLSLVLFKSISKHWRSLIKDAINLNLRHSLDEFSGLFIQKYTSSIKKYSYNFVPLDIRIPIGKSSSIATKFTFGPDAQGYADILHSCNGLLLCRTRCGKLYVYNPSITNMFKVLPHIVGYDYRDYYDQPRLKMAFDPTKSPHYKVIYCKRLDGTWVQIHTYSSKMGNWSLCGDQFPEISFLAFQYGVYWNDAIYWIRGCHSYDGFFKLDIKNQHPVLTALPFPLSLDSNDGYECMLFESGGSLLLGCKGDASSRHFTIYEKRNEYSEWSQSTSLVLMTL